MVLFEWYAYQKSQDTRGFRLSPRYLVLILEEDDPSLIGECWLFNYLSYTFATLVPCYLISIM